MCRWIRFGMGMNNITQSYTILTPAFANAVALRLMHCEQGIVQSHAPLMGVHWKRMRKLNVRPEATANAILAIVNFRNQGALKTRR
jgi:hypothetical protein